MGKRYNIVPLVGKPKPRLVLNATPCPARGGETINYEAIIRYGTAASAYVWESRHEGGGWTSLPGSTSTNSFSVPVSPAYRDVEVRVTVTITPEHSEHLPAQEHARATLCPINPEKIASITSFTHNAKDTVFISWEPPTSGPPVDGYRVDYYADGELAVTINTTETSDSQGNSLYGKQVYAIVYATNTSGGISVGTQSSTITILLNKPTLSAAGGDGQVDLTMGNHSVTATHTEIWRSTNGVDFSLLETITVAASYTDNAVQNGTQYWYQIVDFHTDGYSPLSDIATATPQEITEHPIAQEVNFWLGAQSAGGNWGRDESGKTAGFTNQQGAIAAGTGPWDGESVVFDGTVAIYGAPRVHPFTVVEKDFWVYTVFKPDAAASGTKTIFGSGADNDSRAGWRIRINVDAGWIDPHMVDESGNTFRATSLDCSRGYRGKGNWNTMLVHWGLSTNTVQVWMNGCRNLTPSVGLASTLPNFVLPFNVNPLYNDFTIGSVRHEPESLLEPFIGEIATVVVGDNDTGWINLGHISGTAGNGQYDPGTSETILPLDNLGVGRVWADVASDMKGSNIVRGISFVNGYEGGKIIMSGQAVGGGQRRAVLYASSSRKNASAVATGTLVTPDGDGLFKAEVTAPAIDTFYRACVEDGSGNREWVEHLIKSPPSPGAADFGLWQHGCADFELQSTAAIANASWNNLLYTNARFMGSKVVNNGDFSYLNPTTPAEALTSFQTWIMHDLRIARLRYGLWEFIPDNHDLTDQANPVDSPAIRAMMQFYMKLFPVDEAILRTAGEASWSHDFGRIRLIATDGYFGRQAVNPGPYDTNIMDAALMQWLKDRLTAAASDGKVPVFIYPTIWQGQGPQLDSWDAYILQKRELAEHIYQITASNAWFRAIFLNGDGHFIAWAAPNLAGSEASSGTAQIDTFQSGRTAHDAGAIEGGPWTTSLTDSSTYVHMDVADSGGNITLTIKCRRENEDRITPAPIVITPT